VNEVKQKCCHDSHICHMSILVTSWDQYTLRLFNTCPFPTDCR